MRALQCLLAGAIDYAGLFPPAALDMRTAVRNYATYLAGADAWALGRFVVPVSRLSEFEASAGPLLAGGKGGGTWSLSALPGPDPATELDVVSDFNGRQAGPERETVLSIDTVEFRVESPSAIRSLSGRLPRGVRAAYEVPLGDGMGAWLDAIAASGGVAKARLGGTSPELFPSTGAVAAWLWATAEAGLEVKATAGLHHALRGDYPVSYETRSPRATMHGFLNVLVGAVLARTLVTTLEGATGTSHLEQLLEERDGSMLRVEPEAIGWRGFRLSSEVIARFRSAVLGIGSCSFEEPLAELSALARPAGG